MTLGLEKAARGRFTAFTLSGRIETQAIAELRKLLELHTGYRDIGLDLKDARMVDREVMRLWWAGHCKVRFRMVPTMAQS